MFKIVVTPNFPVDTNQYHGYLPVVLHFTDLLSQWERQLTAPSLPCDPTGMISVVQWVGGPRETFRSWKAALGLPSINLLFFTVQL